MGSIHIHIAICLLTVNCEINGVLVDKEPMCLSRFDYDYKVLSKLVELESELNKAKEERNSLKSSIEQSRQGEQVLSNLVKLESELNKAKEELNMLKAAIEQRRQEKRSHLVGNTYVRWGRTSCPKNGTILVYEGYAGGSFYEHKGGAANYLCLTKEPLWNKYDDKAQGGALVYGAEYEIDSRDSNAFYGIPRFDDQNVPCAVCETTRPSILMIPGRNRCFGGWTLEYHGYLAGGNHNHEVSSEFVCLDGKPEIIPGSSGKNGKLFYFSEGRCGSLRCPPYVEGREITCVVCSK